MLTKYIEERSQYNKRISRISIIEFSDLAVWVITVSRNINTSKRKLQDFLKSWYFIIFPPLGITVFGIIISQINLIIVLVSIAVVLVMIFLAFGVVYIYVEKFEKHLKTVGISDEIYEEMKKMLNQYWAGEKPGVPGVIRDEDLAKIEEKIECTEIWLISYDLRTELNDGLYQDVVANNIKRGIEYKYFTASVPGIKEKINNEIVNKLPEEVRSNFEYKLLNNDFFFLVDNIDFVIYDPYNVSFSSDTKYKAYMSLFSPDDKIVYEAPMNNDLRDRIIARLTEYVRSDKKIGK